MVLWCAEVAGCGRASTYAYLAEQGLEVLGLEPNLDPEVADAFANWPGVELVPTTIAEFDRPEILGTADVIVLFGVLHCCSNRTALEDLLTRAMALAAPRAPVALTWITPDFPIRGAFLPSRDAVIEIMKRHERVASEWWEVDSRHSHGNGLHEHRIAYTWRSSASDGAASSPVSNLS